MSTHVRTSARAIVSVGDTLLVIRYADERGHFYVLPGGGQRHGEVLTETLVREVSEETGLCVRVGPLRFVREVMTEPGSRALPADFHQVELFFACELAGPGDTVRELDPGQDGVEWVHDRAVAKSLLFPRGAVECARSRAGVWVLGESVRRASWTNAKGPDHARLFRRTDLHPMEPDVGLSVRVRTFEARAG